MSATSTEKEAPQKGASNIAHLRPLTRLTLGAIVPYLEIDGATDIHINKPHEVIVITTNGGKHTKFDEDLTLEQLMHLANILATNSKQNFGRNNPRLSCNLPRPFHGRVQINAYDTVESGISISIRLLNSQAYPLSSYFSEEDCERIRRAVKLKKNIFIVGATGSGKTTLGNALIKEIPPQDRILTLEDPVELIIEHEDTVRFTMSSYSTSQSSFSASDMAMDLMRHNPERFILGEIRKHNVFAFLELLNSGHGGTISTYHANSTEKAFDRIVSMASGVSLGGMTFSPDYIRDQLDEIDLIIHLGVERDKEGAVCRRYNSLLWTKEEV